jgi:hypothetical protein
MHVVMFPVGNGVQFVAYRRRQRSGRSREVGSSRSRLTERSRRRRRTKFIEGSAKGKRISGRTSVEKADLEGVVADLAGETHQLVQPLAYDDAVAVGVGIYAVTVV